MAIGLLILIQWCKDYSSLFVGSKLLILLLRAFKITFVDQLVVKLSVILTSRLTVKISVIDWLTIKQTLINLSVVKITVVDVTCNKIIHIVEKDCLFDLFVGKFAL